MRALNNGAKTSSTLTRDHSGTSADSSVKSCSNPNAAEAAAVATDTAPNSVIRSRVTNPAATAAGSRAAWIISGQLNVATADTTRALAQLLPHNQARAATTLPLRSGSRPRAIVTDITATNNPTHSNHGVAITMKWTAIVNAAPPAVSSASAMIRMRRREMLSPVTVTRLAAPTGTSARP